MFSVLVGGIMSDPFNTNTGVRQGCPLSPCWFNLFLEQIMAKALDGFERTVSIGGRMIHNLRFEDDIDLVAGTTAELDDFTDRLDQASILYGMEICLDNSKVLSMGTEGPQQYIVIQGGKLDAVNSFKYLWSTLTKDGRSETEIKMWITITTSALARLQPIWSKKDITLP